MRVRLPVRTFSEANEGGGWAGKHRRTRSQRRATKTVLGPYRPPQGERYRVTLTRVSPGTLDGDNLRVALKHVRDEVACWLLPANRGNQHTRWADDVEGLVEWAYDQRKPEPGERFAVELEVEPIEEAAPHAD